MERIKFIFAIMLVTLFCVLLVNNKADAERSQLESRASVCIENGYDVYVDGMLVDGTAVDLAYYNITISDESHKVLLTKEAKKTNSLFGFE